MVTGREVRFGAFILLAFVVLLFVTCGHGSAKSQSGTTNTATTPTALISQTAPPTPPPASPLAVPGASSTVASVGSGDTQYTISPATYASVDACADVASDAAVSSAPSACQQEWQALQTSDVPGADLMNTMGMPHTVSAGPGVSQTEAVNAATAFYRWQAFQTWAENNSLVNVMQDLDPPGHSDPVVAALTGSSNSTVSDVPQCNLPVRLRVVHLDSDAMDYIKSQGWSAPNNLAVLATYPQCAGVSVTDGTGKKSTVAPSVAETAVNPGELTTASPFGQVWKIEGEAECGSSPQLDNVCHGGT